MKNSLKEQNGFALITVVLALVLISILGITIIGVTTSTFKMAKMDSKSQSAYYIAEAGINKAIDDIRQKVNNLSEEVLSHEDFFIELNKYIDKELELVINGAEDKFEDNFGEIPLAKITINNIKVVKAENIENNSEMIVSYNITSRGEIGKSSRTLSTAIEIIHGIKIEKNMEHHNGFDYAIYSAGDNTLKFPGGSIINGSVYAKDVKFEAANTIINGSIISEKSIDLISAVNINGNLYAMDGKVNLSNSNIKMKGDIHSTDDVILSDGTTVNGNIYNNKDVELKSSNVEVKGDIHSQGNIKLGSSSKVKNIYVGGNLEFMSNNATINGDIHATGYVGSENNGNSVTINGNIISDSNVITRSYQSYKIYGNVYAAKSIKNGNNNYISGDAISEKNIENLGTIDGEIFENSNSTQIKNPIPPENPDFEKYNNLGNEFPLNIYEIGTKNIKANSNSTIHDISPGAYNDVELKWNDTFTFTGGNYYFNKINASDSGIKLKLDLSKGPINIYAKGNISFGSGFQIYVSQDGENYTKIDDNFINNNKDLAIELAGKVYWETYKDFKLKENCQFLGSVLANNNFDTSSSVKLVGAYIVNKGNISMGYGSEIIYAQPTTSDAGNNGDAESSDDGGKNIIDSKKRVTITKSIKEI